MFVGGVIVEDGVDHFAGRHGALDGIEKADEFLVEVALHAAPDDLALNAAGGFPALRSRTRPHAFTHDGPRSRISRAANRVVVPWRS